MSADQGQGREIVAALRAAGVSVSLDADGDLDVDGKPPALAVWHSMMAAIVDLPKLVAEALRAETGNRSIIAAATDPPERWEHLNDSGSLDTMMNHALGGGEPAAVPVAKATVAPSIVRREEYRRAPRVAGVPIATPAFQRWRELWRQAAAQGRELGGDCPNEQAANRPGRCQEGKTMPIVHKRP
jgi:hypothetical protein